MELIDTHCHLISLAPRALEDVFENAARHSVQKFVNIGVVSKDRSAHEAVALADKYEFVWTTVGVHPHDALDFSDLETFEALATHEKVVAIGETGLDFFKRWSPFDAQERLFRNSIAFAKNCNKPLVIHCRDAEEKTLQVLKEESAEKVGGVFHCFAGDAEFAKKIFDLNFIVSFTGNITFKKAEAMRKTVSEIPLERMMVETDCPYMAPEPFRGKPSEPAHVYQIAKKIAEVKGVSIEEVARVTTASAKRLFGMS